MADFAGVEVKDGASIGWGAGGKGWKADRLGSGDGKCGKGIWLVGRGPDSMVVWKVVSSAVGVADVATGNDVVSYPGRPYGKPGSMVEAEGY